MLREFTSRTPLDLAEPLTFLELMKVSYQSFSEDHG